MVKAHLYIFLTARVHPIPPISEYRRFFVSPEIGGIGGDDCIYNVTPNTAVCSPIQKKFLRNQGSENGQINLGALNWGLFDLCTQVCTIFVLRSCSSMVGMAGGEQIISLGVGCRQEGKILHEIGHTLGNHSRTYFRYSQQDIL